MEEGAHWNGLFMQDGIYIVTPIFSDVLFMSQLLGLFVVFFFNNISVWF